LEGTVRSSQGKSWSFTFARNQVTCLEFELVVQSTLVEFKPDANAHVAGSQPFGKQFKLIGFMEERGFRHSGGRAAELRTGGGAGD